MSEIVILSSSIRKGRNSDRVALYLQRFIKDNRNELAEIIDLEKIGFPLFEERLKYLESPSKEILDFAARIKNAKAVIIVSPEYNGGYPASLKNVIDLLYDEWRRKPVAIAAVSSGDFGGTQMIQQLQFVLWKIGAWMVPARFHVAKVTDTFSEDGLPSNKERSDKQAKGFVDEIFWCIERSK
jgi:NAD(P)H-dependent FMN reductase